jgi:hypothetical protein
LVKKNSVGVEKSNIIGSQPSVEEGIAVMLNKHMCLTSRICEQAGCWRNRVFFGHFKTFVARLSRKSILFHIRYFQANQRAL